MQLICAAHISCIGDPMALSIVRHFVYSEMMPDFLTSKTSTLLLVALTGWSCGLEDKGDGAAPGDGGVGASSSGGIPGASGFPSVGGDAASSGAAGSGGSAASGGSAGTSGGSGGLAAAGGVSGSAGAGGAGGNSGAGGSGGTSGLGGSGGVSGSGGSGGTGGASGSGGSGGTGGASGSGGSGGGACSSDCGPLAVCVGSSCLAGARVFVTQKTYDGDLNGVNGADNKCRNAAINAGLGSFWRAWVSTSSGSPSSRFHQSTIPYRLLDGTEIASNWSDLTDGALDHPINLSQKLKVLSGGEVWTNSTASGSASPSDGCYGFTSNGSGAPRARVGSLADSDLKWSSIYTEFCDRTNVRIYCFEQECNATTCPGSSCTNNVCQ